MLRKTAGALVFLTLAFLLRSASAEESLVSIQSLGTERALSFPKLLRVHLVNPAYTPVNLAEAVAASELVVDGKSFRRTAAAFNGPLGISPKGDWDGCLSPNDYAVQWTPGSHKVRLKIAGAQSDPIVLRWFEPVAWQKGTMKTRQKEIEGLASFLTKGLPRSCVEEWLKEQDGGLQEGNRVRYFLEPQFKIVVPYGAGNVPGADREVVSGSIEVYQENRITD